ncbi:hypothetical protein SBA5_120007 [Candidatus Sulfotelmatomonas gaucii]|uniref:Uncharacterized protein n=1 Tax=Candidatus Sulfuritelmatomonas gaucii TaxID=2043161 RepID=A0A2N9L3Y2_9BACT|nr:hypothetical protein SBA5_120007 [Candidatus Sulfotelmatomonas gaucii]
MAYRNRGQAPYLIHISGWLVDTALNPCASSASTSFMFWISPPPTTGKPGEIARTRSSIFGATSAGNISSACTGEFFNWLLMVSIAPESSRKVR